ncbi:MAG TPA: YceI family protein [Terriglobales bacterium]|nr:YceI family protein [Terriglobales bacterium]
MPTIWNIDPVHTNVQFAVRHMMVSNVKGVFAKTSGTVALDDADFTRSQVEVEIDVASLDTREPMRDNHLRSADFLEAEKYPVIRYRSTQIVPSGDGFAMAGELTIHGVTRPVTLAVEPPVPEAKDPWGNLRRGFEAAGEISRKEFGLVWNQVMETGGVAVGDKVKISLEVELVQAKAAGA